MKFKVNFTDNISLIYELVEEDIVSDWTTLIQTRITDHLCPNNHYVGYVSDELLAERIARLYELADYINEQTPDEVIKREINKDTYVDALNVMHVHFPLLKNDEKYQHIWSLLSEYNDIIHWIESAAPANWSNYTRSPSSLFRITLDFNKSDTGRKPIPEQAYKMFDPNSEFGSLMLHYTHVGKNASELYYKKDFVCPKDQFLPQREFTASVRLLFTDNYPTNHADWKKFYDARGRDFWGIDFDDPKLAFGFIKIGQLLDITVDGISTPIPKEIDDMHSFRKQLVKTKVLGWKII